jgi:hypothetical protein
MRRILSWLAFPFVVVAMVVVPLFGGHFCPQEAIPLLGGAAALPFIGPVLRRLASVPFIGRAASWVAARLRKPHCCDTGHSQYTIRPVLKNGRFELETRPRVVRDIQGPDFVIICADGHPNCHGNDPRDPTRGGLCRCSNVAGVHDKRVSCP